MKGVGGGRVIRLLVGARLGRGYHFIILRFLGFRSWEMGLNMHAWLHNTWSWRGDWVYHWSI